MTGFFLARDSGRTHGFVAIGGALQPSLTGNSEAPATVLQAGFTTEAFA